MKRVLPALLCGLALGLQVVSGVVPCHGDDHGDHGRLMASAQPGPPAHLARSLHVPRPADVDHTHCACPCHARAALATPSPLPRPSTTLMAAVAPPPHRLPRGHARPSTPPPEA